jgi:tetratricopeptide (TPR) repeat protein
MNYIKTGFEKEDDILYMQELDKRLQKNPHDISTLIEKGFLQLEPFLQVDNAVKTLELANQLKPNNVNTLFWLAKVYYHGLCDEEKTRKVLRKALSINPHRADCHDLLAEIIRYIDKDEITFLYHLIKAVECEPTFIFPRERLCYFLIEKNALDEAGEVYFETLKIYNSMIFPIPKAPLERYYEGCVTGRYPEVKNRIDELLKTINAKRAASKLPPIS